MPGSPQHFAPTASVLSVSTCGHMQGRGGAGGLGVLQNVWCQPAGVELGLVGTKLGGSLTASPKLRDAVPTCARRIGKTKSTQSKKVREQRCFLLLG